MNRVLAYLSAVLLVLVILQWISFRKIAAHVRFQEQVINDYWQMIDECTKGDK